MSSKWPWDDATERRLWERQVQAAAQLRRWAWLIALIPTALCAVALFFLTHRWLAFVVGAASWVVVFVAVRLSATWGGKQAADWIAWRWGKKGDRAIH